MKYADEESRDQFHKAGTFFQLVCAMLESFCFLYATEPEFLTLTSPGNGIFLIEGLSSAQQQEVEEKMNTQFKRFPGDKKTCSFSNAQENVCQIFVTSPKDLASN